MSVSVSCFSPLSLGFRFQLLLWRTKRYVSIDTSYGEVGLYGVSKIQVSSITSERIDPNTWERCLQKRIHPRNSPTKFEESSPILRGPPETSPWLVSMKLQVMAKLDFGLSTHRYKFWRSSVILARIELQSRLRCLQKRLNEPDSHKKFDGSRTIFRGPPETSP